MADEEEETTVEASLDELIAKRAEDKAEEEEEESILDLERDDEKSESVASKVLPKQQDEFVCKNCFLVKHRSQLSDKKRMFCRDCA